MNKYIFKNSSKYPDYYIAINQIAFEKEGPTIDRLIEIAEIIQKSHKDTILLFFDEKFVLNQEHILNAWYFVQRAFQNGTNISNKKNLEFFLYVAAKRQIKLGLEGFGIKEYNVKNKRVSYCIYSLYDNLIKVNMEINQYLNSKVSSLNIGEFSDLKYANVKDYFEFSDIQINSVIKSYYAKNVGVKKELDDLMIYFRVLNDLIREKMVLLSLEKVKSA